MTHPPLMRGFTALRQHISGYLANTLPDLIDVAREQWGDVDEYNLPYPKKYDWYDITLVNEYPAIGLVPGNDSDPRRIDITDQGARETSTRYSLRLFIVAASPLGPDGKHVGEPKQAVLQLRDDLTRLVHAALLESPNMGRSDIELIQESLTSDYLEPIKINNQTTRWVAAGLIGMEVRFTEYTRSLSYGVAEKVRVDADKVGFDTSLY